MGKEKKDLEFDGEIALFEGKPFNGVCVVYFESGKKQFEEKLLFSLVGAPNNSSIPAELTNEKNISV